MAVHLLTSARPSIALRALNHGPTVVVTGIPGVLVGDIPIATVGSVTSCGAVVATGSGDVEAG